ncbi:MAG: hypothetical protein ABIH77_03695 [Pseudomonadota bacterium]
MDPSYSIKKFKQACKQGKSKVLVLPYAKLTARKDFGLKTKKEILRFVANDGLEHLKFICTNEWRANPDKKNSAKVDSYEFYSGKLYGYIAFVFIEKTQMWLIKSFKKNENSGVRHQPFQVLEKLIH